MTEEVRTLELDTSTLPALEELFGGNGAVAGCWCTWFWQTNERLQANGSSGNRDLLRSRVRAGDPIGILAMSGERPLGWVAVGPRSSYPRLDRSPVTRAVEPGEDGIWSVTCFFVHRTHRRIGLARRLLDAAVDRAGRGGARVVEGYPVDTSVPRTSRVGSGELYHGTLGMFISAGFEIAERRGQRRAVVRLALS